MGAAAYERKSFNLTRPYTPKFSGWQFDLNSTGGVFGSWMLSANLYGLKQTRHKRSRLYRYNLASRAFLFCTCLEVTEGHENEIAINISRLSFHITGKTVIHLLKS